MGSIGDIAWLKAELFAPVLREERQVNPDVHSTFR